MSMKSVVYKVLITLVLFIQLLSIQKSNTSRNSACIELLKYVNKRDKQRLLIRKQNMITILTVKNLDSLIAPKSSCQSFEYHKYNPKQKTEILKIKEIIFKNFFNNDLSIIKLIFSNDYKITIVTIGQFFPKFFESFYILIDFIENFFAIP
ncbi:hypothetical protein BpHYR1_004742 [Brachionus plicatilis]|uniref:Uncharacterized protein n=1 Tax=Brachionus plicatilis TaxID=10195 RepID=A0A3M7PMN2_BRAPC|nr:hypothetical protein BpHYR1_004742 [Brachionus plicatilis]